MELTLEQEAQLSDRIRQVIDDVDGDRARYRELKAAAESALARLNAGEGYLQGLQALLRESKAHRDERQKAQLEEDYHELSDNVDRAGLDA